MSRWIVPIGALGLLLLLLGLFFRRSAQHGGFAEEGSSYRAEADGSRALYLLLSSGGLRVERLHRSLDVVEHSGVLVLIGVGAPPGCAEEAVKKTPGADAPLSNPLGGGRQLRPRECQALLDWVWHGGRLVYVEGKGGTGLWEAVGITAEHTGPAERSDAPDTWAEGESDEKGEPAPAQELEGPSAPLVELRPGQPSAFTAGIERVRARVDTYLAKADGIAVRLLEDPGRAAAPGEPQASAVGLAIPYGSGWFVAVSAPDLASNARLVDADDAAFWLALLSALAEGDPVAFDEYHHGLAGRRGLMGYAASRGLWPALLQIAFAFVVGAFAGRRFGDPVRRPPGVTKSDEDYISSMARLYQLGRHDRPAARRMVERALRVARTRGVHGAVAAQVDALQALHERLQTPGATPPLRRVARRVQALYLALNSGRRSG